LRLSVPVGTSVQAPRTLGCMPAWTPGVTEPARNTVTMQSLRTQAAAHDQELLAAWLAATNEAFALIAGDTLGMPVIAASESWARMCALPLDEVVGHPCEPLLEAQSEVEGESLLRRVRHEGTVELRLLDRPQRGRPWWSSLSVRAVGTNLLLVRRTALAEVESPGEELRTTLDHYARAAGSGSHGLWDWNLVTGEVWYSPSVKALLGYEPADAFPETFDGFHAHVVPEDAASVFNAVRRHLEQRHALDLECRVRTRSGQVRWIELRGTATRDQGGYPLRLAGSLLDISERRQSEETARHAQGLQRSALDALTLAVGVLDAQGEIVETNRSWLAFEDESALVGRHFAFGENYAAVCENAQQSCGQAIAAADGVRAVLEGRRDTFALTYRLDGTEGERHFELRVQPFVQPAGRGAIITHIDVSATRVAYARLAESRDFD
jgi:PAS domain S-box-containing protein